MFWTAPELLRDGVHGGENKTGKGDVYSFAIILQEIIYRAPPFHACNETNMIPKGMNGRPVV